MIFVITNHFYSKSPVELRRVEADYLTTSPLGVTTEIRFWNRSGKWWKRDRCVGFYELHEHESVAAVEGAAETAALERMYRA